MGISKWVKTEQKEEIPFLGIISDTVEPSRVIQIDSQPTIEEF